MQLGPYICCLVTLAGCTMGPAVDPGLGADATYPPGVDGAGTARDDVTDHATGDAGAGTARDDVTDYATGDAGSGSDQGLVDARGNRRDARRPDATVAPDSAPPGSTFGAPCADVAYAGWYCRNLSRHSALHSTSFALAVRWNIPQRSPRATALWLLGGSGKGSFRAQYNGAPVQDKLASIDRIRSVEIEFTDAEGYWRPPRRGYPDTAWVYLDIVQWLQREGVVFGDWVTHIGGSNGSMLGAMALARHAMGAVVGRYVLLSGPFLADFQRECSDPGYHAFMTVRSGADLRSLMDYWNGWDGAGAGYCAGGSAAAVPSYASRGLLGGGALQSFGAVSINVIVGDLDEFGPWLLRSNDDWYNQITAAEKSKHVIADAGHDVIGGGSSDSSAWLAHVQNLVYQAASRAPGVPAAVKPRLIWSKTPDGPPALSFRVSETVYGRVLGVGSAAQGCVENVDNRGYCTALANWVTMPNGDWARDASGVWRADVVPRDIDMGAGTYYGWWRDARTGQLTDRVALQLTP